MGVMFWWMLAGYALEVLGIGLTARGLYRAWQDNADGRPFLPPRVGAAVRRLLRRGPERHYLGTVSGTMNLSGNATGFASATVDPEAPVAEQIAAVAENARRAQKAAAEAMAAVHAEQRRREKAVRDLTQQVESVRTAAERRSRQLVVEGIPMAVAGLGFVLLGFFVQAGATLYGQFTGHV